MDKSTIEFAVMLKYAPKKCKADLRRRFQLGEFSLCGSQGLRLIRYVLEFYPEYGEKILEFDYSEMKEFNIKNIIRRLVPGFTETPIADAFRNAVAGYQEILRAAGKISAALEQYPLRDIPAFRRGMAAMQVLGLQSQIERWLVGHENSTFKNSVINVEAKIVSLPPKIINLTEKEN